MFYASIIKQTLKRNKLQIMITFPKKKLAHIIVAPHAHIQLRLSPTMNVQAPGPGLVVNDQFAVEAHATSEHETHAVS